MKQVGMAIILVASFCCAQEAGDFQPSSTNVWAAEYPRVDSAGRVQIRVKAPDATKVRLNFWSGPKVDMEKGTVQVGWTKSAAPVRATVNVTPSEGRVSEPARAALHFVYRQVLPPA